MVRVDPWAVAYLNRCGEIKTAWLLRTAATGGGTQLKIWVESGLPAFPSEDG